MTAKCTAAEFNGIVNPYTGEAMVVMLATNRRGGVKFFAPDTYSPSDRQPTAELALRMWNRISGVEGSKDGKPVVCAYTGKPLCLKHDADGWWYDGGFNPHLFYDREDFLKFAYMRDGKSPYSGKKRETRVDSVVRIEKKRVAKGGVELSDEAVETAEGIINEFKGVEGIGTEAPVSMSVPTRKKGRNGKR